MPQRASDHATVPFEQAERRLFAACGVQVASRRVRLDDPPVDVESWRRRGRRSSSCTGVA